MIAVDIIFILILLFGGYEGWKKGFFESFLRLTGSFLIFIIAYQLKSPVSSILMTKMPFISFGGAFNGISSINIIIYEAIAFTLVTIALSIIFRILLKVSGIFNKLLNTTFITGIPNKLLGVLINLFRYYIALFIIALVMSLIPQFNDYVIKSRIPPIILNDTPVLSSMTKNINNTLNEIYKKFSNLKEEDTPSSLDKDTLEILLKNNIITVDQAIILFEDGKLQIDDFEDLVRKYE